MVDMGAVVLSKQKSLYDKAKLVKERLAWINIEHTIEKVYIEENLQAFRPGLSSAKTLLTLARFNGIISYICSQEYFLEPEMINVNRARKVLDIKIDRKSDKSTKEQILEWTLNRVDYPWPTKTLKSGPRKGQVILDSSCYDTADAYVIVAAGIAMK
jgi:hypothetical protein